MSVGEQFWSDLRRHRKDPLPANTWVVIHGNHHRGLHVPGPGRIELWDETEVRRPFAVAKVRRGRVLGRRIAFIAPDGARTRVRAVEPGAVGLGEAGSPVRSGGSSAIDWIPDDDLFGLLVLIPVVIVQIVRCPARIARAVRRRRAARTICRAVQS